MADDELSGDEVGDSIIRPPEFGEVAEKLAVENLRKGLKTERTSRQLLEEIYVRSLENIADLEVRVTDLSNAIREIREQAEKADVAASEALNKAQSETTELQTRFDAAKAMSASFSRKVVVWRFFALLFACFIGVLFLFPDIIDHVVTSF